MIINYAKRSIEEQLSVRDLERIIKARSQFLPSSNKIQNESNPYAEKLKNLEKSLETKIGARVKLNLKDQTKRKN